MTQPAPAGWYPDPSGKPRNIYWDGRRWVEPPAPFITPPTGRQTAWTRRRLIAIGAALAVVVAFVVLGFAVLVGHACSVGGCRSNHYSYAYQAGRGSAKNGEARNKVKDPDRPNYDLACGAAYPTRDGFDRKEWMQGCMEEFRDHPVVKVTQTFPPCGRCRA
jgi:hypothetical protein